VNIRSIKQGIAANAAQIPGLNTYAFTPAAVEVPCFHLAEVDVQYHETYGGDAEIVVTGYVLTSTADDDAGQALLDEYRSVGNERSLIDAIEGTPGNPQTLGGACDDLVIMQASGYRMYQVGDKNYYGAKMPIRVIGVRTQE
jgi:hypothetical protein